MIFANSSAAGDGAALLGDYSEAWAETESWTNDDFDLDDIFENILDAIDIEFEFSIVGTSVQFDPLGLPAHLEGNVFYAGGAQDGQLAGTYEEALTPILDPDFGFVGTTGVSLFTFFESGEADDVLGTLTTHNQSSILGVDATGALHVVPGSHPARSFLP